MLGCAPSVRPSGRPSYRSLATLAAGVALSVLGACGHESIRSAPPVSTAPLAVAPLESGPEEAGGSRRGARYVVRRGDTLWSISRDHGIPVQSLMHANGIPPRDATRLQIGRTLRIPEGTAQQGASAAPYRATAPAPARPRTEAATPRALLLADAHLGQAQDRYDGADFEGALGDARQAGRLLAGLGDKPGVRERRVRALLLEGMSEAALGQMDRARASFREARLLDPGLSLDPAATSPKLINVFDQAGAP